MTASEECAAHSSFPAADLNDQSFWLRKHGAELWPRCAPESVVVLRARPGDPVLRVCLPRVTKRHAGILRAVPVRADTRHVQANLRWCP
jgi:hypothetical protein